ncbi:MAG: methyltransferase domain-containing protein [Candidatus Omnitrophica bacterium]|nr:methyltransferase domain-containing protein [Candidatus Omnitrophota bacterium]
MIESGASQERLLRRTAKDIDSCYDEGYFHGQGSGYGQSGYEKEHADWSDWIRWTQSIVDGPIRWLDIGCAYGRLLRQAAKLGVEAYGIDISSYALKQDPSIRENLVQSLADQPPFQEQSFDIVSLFDLLEHVENPNAVLEAVEFILKPDGICFLSTPDPLYFDRDEPTHIHERPPSYWVNLLRRRGWLVEIRFGGQEYEVEIAACRKSTPVWERIQQEFSLQRSRLSECLIRKGEPFYNAVRTSGATTYLGEDVCVYLLNPADDPQLYTFSLCTNEENHPDLFIGDLKLRYLGNEKIDAGVLHHWSAASLPPGGHDVFFRVEGKPIQTSHIFMEARRFDRETFLLELPFDHYQRYRAVASMIEEMPQESLSILDVGGVLGHLQLFLPQHRVFVLDRVWEDAPNSLQYTGPSIPFNDQSFDVVVSVDTLEHIPQDERSNFLTELVRTSREAVIVCGPFNDPYVAESESALRDFLRSHLNREDRFLNEHALYTLPDKRQVIDVLHRHHHFSTVESGNGFLPRWLSMQMASFSLGSAPELDEGERRLNALYNSSYYEVDNQPPCYRTLIAAFRHTVPKSIQSPPDQNILPSSPAEMWPVTDIIVSIAMQGVLREKEAYLRDQGDRLSRFLDHIKNLENSIQEGRKHAANLEAFLDKHSDRLEKLQRHGDNLSQLLEDQRSDRENHLSLLEQAQKRNEDLIKHASNLESLLQSQQKHAANLESMLQESQKHAANLDAMIQESHKHSRNLEELFTHQENQFKDMLSRLQIEPLGPILDAIPHLESRIQNLLNENQNYKKNIDSLLSYRLIRFLKKLGWRPIGREPKSE